MTQALARTLSPTQLSEEIEEHLDRRNVSDFQRPFIIQRMLEKVRDVAYSMTAMPVDIEEFVCGDEFLDKGGTIYPRVMDALIELNTEGRYDEAVLTGGIGSGKTTIALYTTAYQLYRLSLFVNPHSRFQLDPTSEIVFIFQSLNFETAKVVEFNRFHELILQAPYFKTHFRADKNIKSKLVFPHRIEVVPITAMETAAIGQNVIGGIIDEVNHMKIVDKSANKRDGGVWDQAMALYNSISRRRGTRFMAAGEALPGILCLPSSKKYPNEFTDVKAQEAKSNPRIYIYDKRAWEISPPDRYSGDMFNLFTGDEYRQPRIMEKNEVPTDEERDLVMPVPVEYRNDFDRDLLSAVREIAGVSTLAQHPYIINVEAVSACFEKRHHLWSRDACDFRTSKIGIYTQMCTTVDHPCFAHVDLGLTGDSAGVAVGYVTGFKEVDRGMGQSETLPLIRMLGILEVKPPPGGEINFAKIRELFYRLRQAGLPLKWISYDSYQSVDSLQILRGEGFVTGTGSLDRTRFPYDVTKSTLYDGRVNIPEHPKLRMELLQLEDDPKNGKIDHPENGSKDCADAFAGVVYGLTMRREIWARFQIPPHRIPGWLKSDSMEQKVFDADTGETT